jgi:hypothetical protein
MARKPNYAFERHERDRAKAARLAEKADAKREERERNRALSDDAAPAAETGGETPTAPVPDEA